MSDAEIASQLRQLQTLIANEDYTEIVPIAEAVLTLRPNDPELQHVYITSLIHASQFSIVLRYLQTLPQPHPYQHQHAYCLYRTKEHSQALQVLTKVKEKDIGVWHLEAQLYYRSGDYQRAADIYHQEFKPEDMDSELATNVLAAYAAAGRADHARTLLSKLKIPKHDLTYEVAYNTACVWIASTQYDDAEQELENAEKMARSSLEEDGADDDEITNEVAGIRVQHAYVLQLKGDTEQALQIYNDVINQKPTDTSVAATASNNIITLRKPDEKLFDSLKRSTKATHVDDDKLSLPQRQAIVLNRCLLFLWGKQNDKAASLVNSLLKEYPDQESVHLVAACLYHRTKQLKKCEDTLRAYISSHPNSSFQSQLTLAQVPLLKGDIKGAIAALESLTSIRSRAGVIATLVALYERANDTDGAVRVLNQAVEDAKKQFDKRHVFTLFEKLAEFQARINPREAAKLYEQLIKDGAADRKQEYLAKLVLATAKFDVAAATKWAASLPPVKASASIDLKTLESSPPPAFDRKNRQKDITSTKGKKEVVAKDAEGDTEMKEQKDKASKKKPAKKRKRLPKGFDPANPGPMPDPERWLPKQERSSYKKGRKRHQKMTGAQGASAGADASLDAAARAESAAASGEEAVLTGKAAKPVNANPMSAAAKKAAQRKGKKAGGKKMF